MKKNLFTKPLALLLSGAMLVGVGCKDYDDDIDNINNRLDGLEEDVVQLQKDVVSLQATQDEFEKIDFSSYVTNDALQTKLDNVLADYAKKSDLKEWLTGDEVLALLKEKHYLAKDEIQALIDDSMLSESDVQDIFNNMLTAEAIMGKIQTDVQDEIAEALRKGGYMTGSSALSTSQVNQILTAVAAAIDEENSGIRNAIKSWLGEDFASYMESYMSTEAGKAALGAAATDAVLAELKKADSDLKSEINDLIAAALTGDEENPFIQKEELTKIVEKYDKAIAQLWLAVGDIAGRIQSLVYVPENAMGYAFFRGATLGDIELTKGKKATMTFRVSPAALAKTIVEGYNAEERTVELEMLPEEVQVVTRGEEPVVFEIEGAEFVEEGKFALIVNTNFDYASLQDNKTYSVALRVSKASSVTKPAQTAEDKDEEVNTGIEFTSAYIPTLADPDNIDITDRIVLAKDGEDGLEQYTAPVQYRMAYDNDKEAVKLLGEYRFVYEDGDKLIELNTAAGKYNWDITPEAEPVYERVETLSGDANTDYLALTPAEPMSETGIKSLMEIGVKNAEKNAGNIDKTVSDKVTFFIAAKVGEETRTIEKGDYEATLTITRRSLGTINEINSEIDWFYTGTGSLSADGASTEKVGYANDLYISEDNFINADMLTSEQYEGVGKSLENTVWDIVAENSDEELVNANNFEVKAVAITNPYAPGDSKVLRYTVKGYKNGTGKIFVRTNIEVNDTEEITLEGTISFNGLDDLKYDVNVPDGEILSINPQEGNIWVAIDSEFYKTMYGKLPEGHFASEEEFVEFMGKSQLNFTRQQADAGTHTAEAGLNVAKGDFRAFFKMRDVDFNVATSYTYKVGENDNIEVANAAFRIALSGSVTINKGNNYFLQRQENLYTDAEVPYMKAKGSLNSDKSKFEIQDVYLTAGYKANKTGDNVTVEYALNLPKEYKGGQPTLDHVTGQLSWGDCTLLEIPVTATMTVDGLLMDYEEFVVKTDAPIDYSKLTLTEGKLEIAPDGVEVTKNVKELLALNDIFGNKIFDNGKISTYPAKGAYDFKAVFGEADINNESDPDAGVDRVSFDPETATVTVEGDDSELVHTITVKIPVSMTYKYDQVVEDGAYELRTEERTIIVKITPKK